MNVDPVLRAGRNPARSGHIKPVASVNSETAQQLSEWLKKWATWIRWNMGELKPLWYPSNASAMGDSLTNYCAGEDDSDIYWETHHVPRILMTLDACIDSLSTDERRAVWYAHGVTKVPPEDAVYMYGIAFAKIMDLMSKRTAL